MEISDVRPPYFSFFTAFSFLLVLCFVFCGGPKPVCSAEPSNDQAATVRAATVRAEQLFPNTTKGFVSIESLSRLTEQWRKTQFGKMLADEVMQPFVKDARRQIAEPFTDRFGITLEGIDEVPSGELAVGLIVVPDQKPGFVLTMQVFGREEQALAYLDRLGEQFVGSGATRETAQIAGEKAVIITFPSKEGEGPDRKAHYLLVKGHLIFSDQASLLELFATRLKADTLTDSLCDVATYKKIVSRLESDLPEIPAASDEKAPPASPEEKDDSAAPAESADTASEEQAEEKIAESATEKDAKDVEIDLDAPLIRWYVEPLAYGKAVSSLMPRPEKRKNKPMMTDILAEIGFDAILGAGGLVTVKTEDMELVHRNYIYAPKPHRLAMKMLSFPNNGKFGAPQWMPRDLASCLTIYVEPLDMFDNFGPLFDSLIMDEQGVWDEVLLGLERDRNGPQINIREELVQHLAQRVMLMSKYSMPITVNSEALVAAVELKEGCVDKVADALVKLFDGDPEVQKSLYNEHIIWQNLPPEDIVLPGDFEKGVPPLGGFAPEPKTAPPAAANANKAKDRTPMFPNGGITVANGCLFVGSDVAYLQEILDRFDNMTDSISDAADYKVVDLIFADMGIADQPHFFQMFARTDETVRPTYELIREGKMPEAQTLFAKIVNALSVKPDTPKGTVRKQQIDGSLMPEFESVRRHFGPAGIYGITEEDGWFIKGFILEK